MSFLPVPNEVIGANTVSINRLGLESPDDMQWAQMGECGQSQYVQISQRISGRTHLDPQSQCQDFPRADAVVAGWTLPVVDHFHYIMLIMCFTDVDVVREGKL